MKVSGVIASRMEKKYIHILLTIKKGEWTEGKANREGPAEIAFFCNYRLILQILYSK